MATGGDGARGQARALLLSMAWQRRRSRLRLQSVPSRAEGAEPGAADAAEWSWPLPSSTGPGGESWPDNTDPTLPVQPTLHLGERLRFGLNQSRCFTFIEEGGALVHDEGRYGAAFEASLADCATLGVQVVRQPGDVELTWPALSVQVGMTLEQQGIGAEVPTLAGLRPTGALELHAVVSDQTVERLADLLSAAYQHGVKIVFTLLHYGQGGVRLMSGVAPAYPRDGEGVVPGSSELPAKARGDDGKEMKMSHVRMNWSPGPWKQVIPDDELHAIDGSTYAFPAQDSAEAPRPLHYQILDPWSPYMRIMARHLAKLAGLALVQAHETLRTRNLQGYTRLADVVEAVELLNEVDHDCTPDRTDMEGSGRAWGRMCYHVARGFRAAVPDPKVRVHLPGLSSYTPSLSKPEYRHTWDDCITFVRGLVAGMTDEYLSRAPKLREPETAAALADKIQGIDLHSYHFRTDDPQVHAAMLPHEVAELREAVVQGVIDGDGDYEDAEPYRRLHVSVFETSTSASLEGSTTHVPAIRPYLWMTPAQFQAFELWRRVLASACADVQTPGWHSWMSGLEGGFVGTGLRQDESTITEHGPGAPRAAWTSYQSLRWLLRRSSGGSIVYPVTASRAEAEALSTSPSAGLDRLVVFELRPDHIPLPTGRTPSISATPTISPDPTAGRDLPDGAQAQWLYVIMLDPSVVLDADDGVLLGLAEDASNVFYHFTSTGVDGEPFSGGGPSTWEADAGRTLEIPVASLVGDESSVSWLHPIVLRSTGRITWTAKVATVREDVGSFPAWVLDRPAWWDAFPEPS